MKKFIPFLLIAFACIAAFWQVALLTETLKYDILDGYLPGHFFISECLRNNIFPLWNPYQQLGFPIYADLSNTNYLVDMILGRLFPYTNITFHILFILYLILAGTGAYKLAKQIKIEHRFSILIGIAYSLSGFFTGNAQHIQFIIGAAWLPLSLYYFLRMASGLKLRDMLLFVTVTSLLISGGYPSIAILLAYITTLIFLYMLTTLLRKKLYKSAVSFSMLYLGSGILLLILSSGIIISIWQSTPYVARFAGLSYDYAITNPFTPESLISVIAPLVPAVHPLSFHTDLSMNNHYFCVWMVLFFIYGMVRRLNLKSTLILAAGIITLFLSFGELTFLHRLFYDYIPLFDKFRHPSTFRVFTILFLLLFTGTQVSRYDPSQNEHFNIFQKVYVGFTTVILVICLFSAGIIIKEIWGPADFKLQWGSLLTDYGVYGPLFIQSLVILLLNSFFVFFILFRKRISMFYPIATILMVAEMVIFTQLNLNYTVTANYNPKEIREFLRNRPYGFPLPDDHDLADNTEQSVSEFPLINNTNTYAKTISPYSRYPFSLNEFNNLKTDSLLFLNVINNKLLCFGDSILPLSHHAKALNRKIRYVFIGDSLYMSSFRHLTTSATVTDTILCTQFSPHYMKFKTRSDSTRIAILLQNNYPGWSVKIDGRNTMHYTVNRSLIGVITPPGEHEITYEYRNPLYKNITLFSFGLQASIVILVLLLKLIETKNFNSKRKYLYICALMAVITLLVVVLKPVIPFNKKQESNNRIIGDYLKEITQVNKGKHAFTLFNTESPQPFDTIYKKKYSFHKRFRFQSEIREFWDMLDTLKGDSLIYVWSNVLNPPEISNIIQMHYAVPLKNLVGDRFTVRLFTKDTTGFNRDNHFFNGYENPSPAWTMDGVVIDSTQVYSGICSEKLSPEREFSSTFRRAIDKVPPGGIKIFSAVQFMSEGNNPFHLVITINRKSKEPLYYAVDLTQFNTHKDGWNRGFASQQWLKSSLRKGDEIVVYCWNSGKNEKIYIDNFFVNVE